MKKLLLSIFVVLSFFTVSGQKKQNVYYLKNDLRVVDQDSADFIRIIQEPDSGSTLYTLFEIYPDGTKKTQGTIAAFDPRIYHQGTLLTFNRNGTRKSVEEYDHNTLTGKGFYYFENGKLEELIDYAPNTPSETGQKVMYLADSLGHVMVEGGIGHTLLRLSASSLWQEEGDYADGEKHGVWTTRNPAGDSSYKETFDHGKFIGGESLVQGISYTYKLTHQAPKCVAGIRAFYDKLSMYLTNAQALRGNHIYGLVLLSFVVELDGSFSEVKVERGLEPILDKYALRSINTGLKWLPGRLHGIPERQKFRVPIRFNRPKKDGWLDFTTPGAMPEDESPSIM
jgi:antitoxin component YwqK of YwqJK toxin-antitoxin module